VRRLVDHADLGEVEIVAFGDQANDIAMVRAAHRGIAVANAIAEVRAVADEIIGPNSDDSVPRHIQADWRTRR
jgi:hydroxymethylpyrimidine pyrophosphatase-like HAD family hydrolase